MWLWRPLVPMVTGQAHWSPGPFRLLLKCCEDTAIERGFQGARWPLLVQQLESIPGRRHPALHGLVYGSPRARDSSQDVDGGKEPRWGVSQGVAGSELDKVALPTWTHPPWGWLSLHPREPGLSCHGAGVGLPKDPGAPRASLKSPPVPSCQRLSLWFGSPPSRHLLSPDSRAEAEDCPLGHLVAPTAHSPEPWPPSPSLGPAMLPCWAMDPPRGPGHWMDSPFRGEARRTGGLGD